jgi:hypothetical protein
MQADPDCMKPLIGPLLRAMHRLAKEHNQAPALGLLSAKADQPAGYCLLCLWRSAARQFRHVSHSLITARCATQAASVQGHTWLRFMVHVEFLERWAGQLDNIASLYCTAGAAGARCSAVSQAVSHSMLHCPLLQWLCLLRSPFLLTTGSISCPLWSCLLLGSRYELARLIHQSCT